jgi:phage-related protein
MAPGDTRPISWVKGALRDFETFPADVRLEAADALTIAAEGGKADRAKPMRGLGSGVFELALRRRGEAFRVVYAAQLGEALWVLHAFHKKSKKGIKTPPTELNVIRERLRRIKETLR